MKKFMGSLDKYKIVPSIITSIKHRLEECIPYYDAFYSEEHGGWCLAGATLPIFASPMACVVDEESAYKFDASGIIPIIPRTIDLKVRLELAIKGFWIAMGLTEFTDFVKSNDSLDNVYYICVDMANGHMQSLLDICQEAKQKFGVNLQLMTGNISNPLTYYEYARVGIDYVRVSIGTGGACLTTTITGVGYSSLANLIKDVCEKKNNVKFRKNDQREEIFKSVPKVVIDGGLHSIKDIIIALALGADYVMCGKIFAQCKEAAGEIIPKLIMKTTDTITYLEPEMDGDPTPPIKCIKSDSKKQLVDGRIYYGMSTERAQHEMGNKTIKHSEGSEQWIPIEYTIKEWVDQFVAAITSTMSYCNARTLNDFIGNSNVVSE